MKRILRNFIGRAVRLLGIHWIFVKLVSRNRATILVYHDPKPQRFREHVDFLAKHHTFVTLDNLVQALETRNWQELPERPLIVTLDDGHKGNYELLEIFRTYDLRPTLFLCSSVVDTHRHFWWQNGVSNVKELKKLPGDRLFQRLKLEYDFEPEKEYADRQALTADELIEMQPNVAFGSHTRFHPILTKCSDEVCEQEINESKTSLEKMLGQPIVHFCFPNGDFGEREQRFVRAAGYRSARTLEWGLNGSSSDPYRLKVIEVLDDASVDDLCATLTGIFALKRKLASIFRRMLRK